MGRRTTSKIGGRGHECIDLLLMFTHCKSDDAMLSGELKEYLLLLQYGVAGSRPPLDNQLHCSTEIVCHAGRRAVGRHGDGTVLLCATVRFD